MPTYDFITAIDEVDIVKAIVMAEDHTSGEIRVHIERHSDLPALQRAQELFHELGMDQTELHNGVLFYVGVDDHQFAIIGDSGIDKVVPTNFWDSTKELVLDHFKRGQYKEGLVNGILKAGEQLKSFFPVQDDNPNELPNQISRG